MLRKTAPQVLGGTSYQIITRFPSTTIGTSAAVPATLTTSSLASTISTVKNITELPNFVFGGVYTPKNYGSRIYILVERSIDKGVTYYPYSTITPETNDILINTSGTTTPAGVAIAGSPFVIPGNAIGTAASGTPIYFSYDLTAAADYIRISAVEAVTSTDRNTLGTLWLQSYFTSN